VADGIGVGGRDVSVGGSGRGVEEGAGIMVRAEVAAARLGLETAAGRTKKIYARLLQSSTAAMTTIAIRTLPLSMFFMLHRQQEKGESEDQVNTNQGHSFQPGGFTIRRDQNSNDHTRDQGQQLKSIKNERQGVT
jgi:hypothetical protein